MVVMLYTAALFAKIERHMTGLMHANWVDSPGPGGFDYVAYWPEYALVALLVACDGTFAFAIFKWLQTAWMFFWKLLVCASTV